MARPKPYLASPRARTAPSGVLATTPNLDLWLENRAGFDFYPTHRRDDSGDPPLAHWFESPAAYPAASWVVVGLGQTGWDLM